MITFTSVRLFRYRAFPRDGRVPAVCGLAMLTLLCAGCGNGTGLEPGRDASGKTIITAWAHHGKPAEWETIQEQVRRFNASSTNVHVKLIEVAEANYDTQVQSAAASDDLPDILEFDGPVLASYAWKGYLQPMGDRIKDTIQNDLLPSIVQQGTYAGKFYAVGTFDSGLGLYANRSLLAAVNARVPTRHQDAWTISEFNDLLGRLAERKQAQGGNRQVLDLKRDYRGEWWIYGFYPILLSAGADVIDRQTYRSADEKLNSPAAVEALTHLQQWFTSGYVDPNADGRAFVDQRVAISWTGHWEYPRYREALGDDLLLLPLPDFGRGSRTAMGSWAWALTTNCKDPDAAMEFIHFLLQPAEILAMVKANGAVPARRAAIQQSALYQEDGPLRLFAEQLQAIAIPRPRTPAYPVISSAFQEAILNLIEGADVKAQLDHAVRVIDGDINDNEGYRPRTATPLPTQ